MSTQKAIELFLVSTGACMMFGTSAATLVGVGIAFAAWEIGAHLITRR